MSGFIQVFNRTEIKYLITKEQYEKLSVYLNKIARVDDYGKTRINNIYFDTPDFRLIRKSLEKPEYKEKLRLRTYGSTTDYSNAFIEIKKKYAGIVYKRRISGLYIDAYEYLVNGGKIIEDSQIAHEVEYFRKMYRNLIPAMKISYDRVAMAGIEDSNLRITFDSNITWTTKTLDLRTGKDNPTKIIADNQYLMEIKVLNAMPIELARKLSELHIYPTSFSKYGRAYIEKLRSDMDKENSINNSTVFIIENGSMKEEANKRGVIAYA